MASLLLTRPYILGAGIGLSLLLPLRAAPLQCQYTAPYSNPHAPPESGWSLAGSEAAAKQGRTSYAQERSSRPSTGLLNARCMRQISLGSVLGLATGLGLRVFSKALVFVLGVGIVVVEWAASRGYTLIPANTLQKYAKKVDIQKATRENVPFKVSFGTTMALAAFANFADYS